MLYQPHESLEKPPDRRKIWHYTTFERLLSILYSNEFYFSTIHSFSDKTEGHLTNKTLEETSKRNLLEEDTLVAKDEGYDNAKDIFYNYSSDKEKYELLQTIHSFGPLTKRFSNYFMFCSCWSLKEHEDNLMWERYGKENPTAVAIQSTVKRLISSMEEIDGNIHIGKITYMDYEKDSMKSYEKFSEINLADPKKVLELFYTPIMHKRKLYSSEKELRIVTSFENISEMFCNRVYTSDIPYYSDKLFDFVDRMSSSNKTEKMRNIPNRIKVGLDLTKLINSIYISPYAEEFLYQTLSKIMDDRKMQKVKIRESEI